MERGSSRSPPKKRPRLTQEMLREMLEAARAGELAGGASSSESPAIAGEDAPLEFRPDLQAAIVASASGSVCDPEAPYRDTDAPYLDPDAQAEVFEASMAQHGTSLAPLPCPVRLVSKFYADFVDRWLDDRLRFLEVPRKGAKVAFADAMRYVSPRFKLVRGGETWWTVADELVRTYADALRDRAKAWIARDRIGSPPTFVAFSRRRSLERWRVWEVLLGREIGPGDPDKIGTPNAWTVRVSRPELPNRFRDLELCETRRDPVSDPQEPVPTGVFIDGRRVQDLVMYGLAKVLCPAVPAEEDEELTQLTPAGEEAASRSELRRVDRVLSRMYEEFFFGAAAHGRSELETEEAADLALESEPTPAMLGWKTRMLVARVFAEPHEGSELLGRRDRREERRERAERWLLGKDWGFSDRAIVDDAPEPDTGDRAAGVLLLPLVWFFALCPREDWRPGDRSLADENADPTDFAPELRTRWGDFSLHWGVPAVIELDSEFALAHQPATLLFLRDDVGRADLDRICYVQALRREGEPLLRRARARVERL
jgi:hypothetical protein